MLVHSTASIDMRSLNSRGSWTCEGRAIFGRCLSKHVGQCKSLRLSTVSDSHSWSLNTLPSVTASGWPRFLCILRIMLRFSGDISWTWDHGATTTAPNWSYQWVYHFLWLMAHFLGSRYPDHDLFEISWLEVDHHWSDVHPWREDEASVGWWSTSRPNIVSRSLAGTPVRINCLRVNPVHFSQSWSTKWPTMFRCNPMVFLSGALVAVTPIGGARYRSAPLQISMATIRLFGKWPWICSNKSPSVYTLFPTLGRISKAFWRICLIFWFCSSSWYAGVGGCLCSSFLCLDSGASACSDTHPVASMGFSDNRSLCCIAWITRVAKVFVYNSAYCSQSNGSCYHGMWVIFWTL